ncbi:MAG: hypothetical protein JXA54_15620 [Candidatus Heimdallarchaeota archaeon]|nr:hypothetical protein [Candidatus Heimdallarchaeota archaeon]
MEKYLLIIILIGFSIIAFLIGYILGLSTTGYNRRTYHYLRLYNKINETTIEQLAMKFKPIIYQRDEHVPSPYKISYEIIEKLSKYIIIYRIFWKNEILPNRLLHYLYAFYRFFYYGSIQDIEFLEIHLSKENHTIDEIHFETLNEKSKPNIPLHEYVTLLNYQNNFVYKTKNSTRQIDFSFIENQQIQLQVASWNHLLTISKSPEGKRYDLPLDYLEEDVYQKYKICRRSSGEISTQYSGFVSNFISMIMALLFSSLPTLIYLLI